VSRPMAEHRWTIPCTLDPDEAERALEAPVDELREAGFEVIPHVETVGFFGWTLRRDEDRAAGVSVPQPGGPDRLMVRSEHDDVGRQVAEAFTEVGPLADEEPTEGDTDVEPVRGP